MYGSSCIIISVKPPWERDKSMVKMISLIKSVECPTAVLIIMEIVIDSNFELILKKKVKRINLPGQVSEFTKAQKNPFSNMPTAYNAPKPTPPLG